MKPEKIRKVIYQENLDFEGDLKDIIIELCRLLGNGFSEIDFEYDFEGAKKWFARKYREETDEEYEQRIRIEERKKQQALEDEKRLYKQLKEKFEKEIKDVED